MTQGLKIEKWNFLDYPYTEEQIEYLNGYDSENFSKFLRLLKLYHLYHFFGLQNSFFKNMIFDVAP